MSRRNIRVRVGMSLLRAFFRRFIHKGTLTVISPDGCFEHIGHGVPSVAIRITNSSVIPWLLTNPDLAIGEAYSTHPASTPGAMTTAKRSGSNGGLGLLVRLPIPGKQVGDFVGGVIWKPGQHVSEPGLRIDVVHLAGFDQGIDGGGSMAASV